ncbi:MAG: ankyrin repeat domain-containing protein [Nitrospirae bacterium]|nr:ankyrin repeat domain-containing protein [Nitrospirota bacterium]
MNTFEEENRDEYLRLLEEANFYYYFLEVKPFELRNRLPFYAPALTTIYEHVLNNDLNNLRILLDSINDLSIYEYVDDISIFNAEYDEICHFLIIYDLSRSLIIATYRGDTEMAYLLIKKGAYLHLYNLYIDSENFEGYKPIHLAAANGNIDLIMLLLKHGADVNDYTMWADLTPLICSVLFEQTTVVEYLLTQGADTEVVDDQGATALVYAVENGRYDIVKSLLENNANVNFHTNYADYLGYTPLMIAVEKNKNELVLLLLEYGADITAKREGDDTTVFDIAENNHYSDILQLLIEHASITKKEYCNQVEKPFDEINSKEPSEYDVCNEQTKTFVTKEIIDLNQKYINSVKQCNTLQSKEKETNNTIENNKESTAIKVLNNLRTKLVDMTNKNKLINYKQSKTRTIYIVDELPDEVFRILVEEKKPMQFKAIIKNNSELLDIKMNTHEQDVLFSHDSELELPEPELIVHKKHKDSFLQTNLQSDSLENKCKKLKQYSQTASEETGCNLLYLVIGFLNWYEDDSSSVPFSAPLILVPVKIDRVLDRSYGFTYSLSYTGEDIETNISLSERLKQDFNISLPEIEADIYPEEYFIHVKTIVQTKKRWIIERKITIDLFSFSKQFIYKDLDTKTWPEGTKITDNQNIIKILTGVENPNPHIAFNYDKDYDIDNKSDHFLLPLVKDADNSQFSAIIDAIEGKDFVIEGPPGTGKSQTITNIIASLLSYGKTVLFVSEKMAALDVVKNRLGEVCLEQFCLELHSNNKGKDAVYNELRKRINYSFEDVNTNNTISNHLVNLKDKLRDYCNLINTPVSKNGETIHQIIWRYESYIDKINGKPSLNIKNALNLTDLDVEAYKIDINKYVNLSKEIHAPVRQAWLGYIPNSIKPDDSSIIAKVIEKLNDALAKYGNISYPDNDTVMMYFKRFMLMAEINENILTPIPKPFYPLIAKRFLIEENVDIINNLHKMANEFHSCLHIIREVFPNTKSLSEKDINIIKNTLIKCDEMGCTGLRVEDILLRIKNIESIIIEIEKIIVFIKDPLFNNLVCHNSTFYFGDIQRIISLYQILEEMPSNIKLYGSENYIISDVYKVLANAKSQYLKLRTDKEEFSKIFVFSEIPSPSEIRYLANVIYEKCDKMFSFLSSEFKNAKSRVTSFLKVPVKIEASFVSQLYSIAELSENITFYQNEEVNIKMLGDLFKGLNTDWETLEAHIYWSNRIKTLVESEDKAILIIKNLSQMHKILIEACPGIIVSLQQLKINIDSLGIPIDRYKSFSELLKELNKRLSSLKEIEINISAYTGSRNITIRDIQCGYDKVEFAMEISKKIKKNEAVYKEILGAEYKATNTDTKIFVNLSNWVQALKHQGNIPLEIICWLFVSDLNISYELLHRYIIESKSIATLCQNLFETLNKHGELDITKFLGCDITNITSSEFHKKIILCIENAEYLSLLSQYYKHLEIPWLTEIIQNIENGCLLAEETEMWFLGNIYKCKINELLDVNKDIINFVRTEHESVRTNFIEIDKAKIGNEGYNIAMRVLKKTIPVGNSSGPVHDYTELSLIKHEINKQKRHITIRKLIKSAMDALLSLKPCFMMSPLTISQYLPKAKLFDVLIMDEASQVKIEDALGAIARAKQIIIVGDPKQLPPTSFFDSINIDEDDDNEDRFAAEYSSSILEYLMETYTLKQLRWHYRSYHESLIAFSNNKFYDDNLVIFPSPKRNPSEYGITSRYIEGAEYLNGVNIIEAQAVANAIIEHYRKDKELTLGVVTFNAKQRDTIKDLIDTNRRSDVSIDNIFSKMEHNSFSFFIKNLENVQGDERDVIFISTTFGPDPNTKKVFQRFGPINTDDGWRRLNVLATRARKKIIVFTSLHPEDIIIGPKSSRGLIAFKDYLKYSCTGIISDVGSVTSKTYESEFEASVAKILHDNGYKTIPQVGVAGYRIDLGVLHPQNEGEYLLGIECDGATYHRGKCVRDRDRLRQEILENKGWNIHRIWSLDWYLNRKNEIQRLLNVIEKLSASSE